MMNAAGRARRRTLEVRAPRGAPAPDERAPPGRPTKSSLRAGLDGL
jgi:hypothetical protein